MKQKTIIKLDLKTAIILEDAKRITIGQVPINNVRQLAFELIDKYPKRYKEGSLDKYLYHLYAKGITAMEKTYRFDEIVEDLCNHLDIEKNDLVKTYNQWA